MPYPDSHLGDSRGLKSRTIKIILLATPFVLAGLWICTYWLTTGVFPVSESYPGGQIKSAGYVRRVGVEAYRQNGHWVTYYVNGQKSSDGFYESGRKTGPWNYWDEGGRPTSGPGDERE